MRHTNVAMRIEQGQNIVYISRQVGHATVKMTFDIYGNLISDVNLELAKKLENVLGLQEHSGSLSGSSRRLVEGANKKDLRKS